MTGYRGWATLGVAALSAVSSMAAAQTGGDHPDPAQVQHGKMLYADHCSHCHGFNMVSAGNVTFDLRTFPRDQRERFFESVTNGRDNRMPPWGDVLTQDEIGDIWAYVCTGGK
ncbi:MAG TPA: cytochrome c [Stellaceae bacterium]|nr:cytochrome c [Stellaceae bacterium]